MPELSARTRAQAKINLFLSVGPLLPSGYHDILTLFQRIELGDEVRVSCRENSTRELQCRGLDSVPVHDNLAFRAAASFSAKFGWPAGFVIELEKQIPVGAGLGGGSADAAAVLRILAALCPETPAPHELQRLALELGSDVPFLVSPHCLAVGEGRGELLRPLRPLETRGLTLFQSSFGIATREAYAWVDAARAERQEAGQRVRAADLAEVGGWEDVARMAANDFEDVVTARHPELAVLLASARSADYLMAEMTGSGSTVFAVSWDGEPVRAPEHVSRGAGQILTRTSTLVAAIGG